MEILRPVPVGSEPCLGSTGKSVWWTSGIILVEGSVEVRREDLTRRANHLNH